MTLNWKEPSEASGKKALDLAIAQTAISEKSGLAVVDVLVGYSKAINQYVNDGTLSLADGIKLTILAAKHAAVVTHYRETGELKEL